MSYRGEQLPPPLSASHWDQVMVSRPDSIPQSPPMSYESQALPFAPETASIAGSPSSPALVFLDDPTSNTIADALSAKNSPKMARRGARRPNPVAIPNLTKKARGRPVPTKDTLLKPGNGRAYACPVEDCRKVFTRSEHLKRHTRSIHTNEKPFRCEELNCGRLFTRHDNLLQHLKNHRHASPSEFGPLERVCVSPSSSPEAHPVSPSMGVLIPPLPRMVVPLERDAAPPAHAAAAYTYSPPLAELSSPGSTPGPAEPAYLEYTYGYAWPQSDVRSLPAQAHHPQYAVAAPAHTFRERVSAGYGFNI
ncbi:uncharacterized protein PHACADRAFT_248642 [Phanerochaete carnosa HHB-10118-sp]|uniref:C2H2-type domain-containing protein n=1 Tax=Phanerochaete carnosa (strain HHB-10118-sp) TaxID=650164 RepID=K5WCU0_PHACS|nr:uncharacterized protein PHACADRAFT_248642 [Phanerochaete carnosa HHB-10118-sp]EKM61783.1 hypothetical protein PHACADRAFT_248642 [Phanerochaete carnosa HHB-10118-sp]